MGNFLIYVQQILFGFNYIILINLYKVAILEIDSNYLNDFEKPTKFSTLFFEDNKFTQILDLEREFNKENKIISLKIKGINPYGLFINKIRFNDNK
jgi:hypothetical protein